MQSNVIYVYVHEDEHLGHVRILACYVYLNTTDSADRHLAAGC